jgi:predicted DNA-binding transcriptional regulator AlpA
MLTDQNQYAFHLAGDCLLTLGEVAPLLGKSVGACRVDMCRQKFPIKPVRQGRLVKFRLSDVRTYLESVGGITQ